MHRILAYGTVPGLSFWKTRRTRAMSQPTVRATMMPATKVVKCCTKYAAFSEIAVCTSAESALSPWRRLPAKQMHDGHANMNLDHSKCLKDLVLRTIASQSIIKKGHHCFAYRGYNRVSGKLVCKASGSAHTAFLLEGNRIASQIRALLSRTFAMSQFLDFKEQHSIQCKSGGNPEPHTRASPFITGYLH